MKCPKVVTKLVPRCCMGIVLFLVLVLVCGDPQWSRWIYVTQVHWLKIKSNPQSPPSKYSGVWRTWDNKGNCTFEGLYERGILRREVHYWTNSNLKYRIINLDAKGHEDGIQTLFYEDG